MGGGGESYCKGGKSNCCKSAILLSYCSVEGMVVVVVLVGWRWWRWWWWLWLGICVDGDSCNKGGR